MRRVFIAGILTALPLGVTVLVLKWLFDALDSIFQPVISSIVGRHLPGVGLAALVIALYLLGLITTNVLGRKALRGLDALMGRLPLVHLIYKATGQVVNALRLPRKTSFNRVVIVEFPRKGMQSIALVTGEAIDVQGEERVPVYIPTAPNPTSGYLVLVSARDILDTDITVDEALKMVISSGLVTPDKVTEAKG
jgi:uncharacterized membrane protein